MARWQETFNISYLHRLYTDGKIKVMQLGKCVAARLKTTSYFKASDPEMIDIMAEFGSLDEYSENKDYNIALDLLMDFGDKYNRLWVETFHADVEVDHTSDQIIHKPVKVYTDYSIEDTQPNIKGPYFNHLNVVGNNSTTTTDNNPTSSRKYNRTKVTRYLSEHDFNKRLTEKGLDPNKMNKDMYTYMKDADDDYQSWLINRWQDLSSAVRITPKQA